MGVSGLLNEGEGLGMKSLALGREGCVSVNFVGKSVFHKLNMP